MKPAHCSCLALAFLILMYAFPAYALNVGDPFPDFSVDNTLSPEHSAYLKLPPGGKVSLKDIPHEVIIVEFLNVYCHTCRGQVPIFNELLQAIAADPDLRDKVCLLGFAVGNSVEEIATFTEEFGPQYPILSDKDKVLFNSTGNIRGTPHTYVIRRGDMGFIVDYHAGGVSSPALYLDSIRHTLRSSLVGTEPGNILPPLTFKAAGKKINTQSLAGERYMLYFGSSVAREVESDLRTMAVQLDVLKKFAVSSNVDIYVFPPIDSGSVVQAIPEPLMSASDTGSDIRAQLGIENQPVVLAVNTYGRVVYRGESITLPAADQLITGVEYKPEPKLSSQQIQDLIRQKIIAAGHQVAEIESVILENRQSLYVITVAPQGSGVFIFARLESGITMCDVCHDSHFVYLFDQEGMVIDFIPLELTKYGNIPWTDEDNTKMKKNLVGHNIFEPFVFNPAVDAVTMATMSSSMIFEAMNRARQHFQDFYEYRFREAYWQNQCFSVICKVKKLAEISRKNPDFVFDDSTLQQIMKDNSLQGCPTGGMYIVLDGDVLCSQHGLNMQGCAH